MKNIELLAPAGDKTKLRLAVKYGADAVYLGGRFGLRAGAVIEDNNLEEAVSFAHSHGKKAYFTVNIFARNTDFNEIKAYVKRLEVIGADAVIVSDLGVLRQVRENTSLEIHISTQANVINKYTAEEYVNLGARRIILARECNITEINEIASHIKDRCDIEIFVHGAMCVSYSGRCLLSNYMTLREANRGECAQPCRYKYFTSGFTQAVMTEEKRPAEHWGAEEDIHGTYIMNSKDLCLINHLDNLITAGVTSFKIEGRMKSDYYVAATVNTYRQAFDKKKFDYQKEIDKIPHRPWTTGFVFEKSDNLFIDSTTPVSTHEVAAMCLGQEKILQRNVFCEGDELEILSPGSNHNKTFKVTSIKDEHGQSVIRANKAGAIYYIESNGIKLEPDEFLRKRINNV